MTKTGPCKPIANRYRYKSDQASSSRAAAARHVRQQGRGGGRPDGPFT